MSYGMDLDKRDQIVKNIHNVDPKLGAELQELFVYVECIFSLTNKEQIIVVQKISNNFIGVSFKFFPRNITDNFIDQFSSSTKAEMLHAARAKINTSDAILQLKKFSVELKRLEHSKQITMSPSSGDEDVYV